MFRRVKHRDGLDRCFIKMRVLPLSGLSGAGFKPPQAAIVSSSRGERCWNRRKFIPSAKSHGDDRERTADDVSKSFNGI